MKRTGERSRAIVWCSQKGFSLVELLIAMVLGLIVTLGMISVFSGNQKSSQLNQAIANLQEDARFALDVMSRDVRMAGFQGCAPISGGSVVVGAASVPMSDTSAGLRSTALWGSRVVSESSWLPMPPWGTGTDRFTVPSSNPGIPGSHTLALQFGDENTYRMEFPLGGTSTPSPSGDIFLDTRAQSLDTGDLAIISDCIGGDLFRVTDVSEISGKTVIKHAAGENNSGTFSTLYGKSDRLRAQTMVMRFNTRVYFVGDTGEVDENGQTVSALYQQDAPFDSSNPPFEIVQGVEQLVVSFEIQDANGLRSTVSAGNPINPASVTAVRIGVLMASEDPIADENDTKVYELAGVEIPPATSSAAVVGQPSHGGDKRFRLAFNTTIKVRNFRDTGN